MAVLEVTASENYSDGDPPLAPDITEIVFTHASLLAAAQFAASQFGPGLISNTVAITGNSQTNRIGVTLSAAGTFSAAGWTFSNWSQGFNGPAAFDDAVFLTGSSGNDTITGSSHQNVIEGGDGADTLVGGAQSDSFRVSVGHADAGESMNGLGGVDELRVVGSGGAIDFTSVTIANIEIFDFVLVDLTATFTGSQVRGGAIAEINGTTTKTQALIINGADVDLSGVTFTDWGGANQTIFISGTSAVANSLIGSDQNETMDGSGSSADTMTGGGGADFLSGGNGNDVFRFLQIADVVSGETVSGGTGTDTLRYEVDGVTDFGPATLNSIERIEFAAPVTVGAKRMKFDSGQFGGAGISNALQLTGDGNFNAIEVNLSAAATFSAAAWTLTNWQTINDFLDLRGSSGNDTLTGSSGRDQINAGNGMDIVNAGAGFDGIFVDSNDIVAGESIDGGADDDVLIASSAGTTDVSVATISNVETLLIQDDGATVIVGGGQIGAGGFTTVDGSGAADPTQALVVNGGSVDLSNVGFIDWGGPNQTITINGTGAGATNLIGSSQSDTINGVANASNTIRGGGGADTLNGGIVGDFFTYGAAGEVVSGEALQGAGGGNDEISLTNAGLNDFSLATIANVENLDFESGASIASFRGNQIGTGLIAAVSGSGGVDTLIVNAASGVNVNLSGVAFTTWTDGVDSIIINGSGGLNTHTGSNRNDIFISSGGNDTFNGGDGDDVFIFSDGLHAGTVASVNGGNGTDTIETDDLGQFNFLFEALSSIERVRFGSTSGSVMIFSSTHIGAGGITSVVGDTGGRQNIFSVTGANSDLSGLSFTNWNAGTDNDIVLVNSSGNGTLIASSQNDTFQVGSGNQSLTGGGGSDTMRYQFASGNGADIFNDFAAGAGSGDKIDLRVFTSIERFSDVLAIAAQVGNDTVIDLGGGQTLTLKNVSKASLHADDFLLAGFFGDPAFAIDTFGASAPAGGWSSQDQYPRTAADVNGDGRADLIGFGDAATFVSLANPNGTFQNPILAINSFGFSPAGGGFASSDKFPRTLGDINGDGLADIVGFGDAGVFVSLANGNGTFQGPSFALDSFGFSPAAGGFTSNDKYPRMVGDVNGDGVADIVGFGDAGVFVSLNNGTFQAPTFALNSFGFSPAGGGFTSNDKYPRTIADVNGDGLVDIVGFGDAGVFVSLNANGTFQAPIFALNSFGFSPAGGGFTSDDKFPRRVADVNDDGRADIVGFGDAGVFVSLANANGTFQAPVLDVASFGPAAGGWSNNDLYPRTLADVNGDGSADVIGFGDAGVFVSLANDFLV